MARPLRGPHTSDKQRVFMDPTPTTRSEVDTLVIGAGPAGLATAACLARHGELGFEEVIEGGDGGLLHGLHGAGAIQNISDLDVGGWQGGDRGGGFGTHDAVSIAHTPGQKVSSA